MSNDDCGIAHASSVVGDGWNLLILRDIARGLTRFGDLLAETGCSRKVLTERLRDLVASEVLHKAAYQDHPERFDYLLTPRGHALVPVLAAIQQWGDTWLLGDGTSRAGSETNSAETHRVRALVGQRVPPVGPDPITTEPLTVVYCFPGAALLGISQVPGGPGCTLESCTYRDRLADFAALGAAVVGVSTQTTAELTDFQVANRIQFPLVADPGLELATCLRLPTFTLNGMTRLKRLTLVVDRERVVRAVQYPINDPAGSVEGALGLVRALR
ncbi:winged helix-turn-helix transcriptional regulator [Calidifontibacter terrae]